MATTSDTFPCPCCSEGGTGCCCCCDYSEGIPATFTATITKISGPSPTGLFPLVLEGVYTIVWSGSKDSSCFWSVSTSVSGGFCHFDLILSCSHGTIPRGGCDALLFAMALQTFIGGTYCFNASPVAPDAGCVCDPMSVTFTLTVVSCDAGGTPTQCGLNGGTYVYQVVITP